MPLQKLPTVDLDNANHRRRSRETLNQVLDHSFDDSKIKTAQETSDGVVVINPAFSPGDARRYVSTATFQGHEWYCYGHQGTYISNTQFSVPGDETAIYRFARRIMLLDTSNGQVRGRITVTSFGSGVDTITVALDSGNVPNPIAAILVAASLEVDGAGIVEYDINGTPTGTLFWNKSNGSAAASRIQVASGTSGTGSDVGLAIVAVQNSYSGAYLPGGLTGRHIVIHTGVSAPIEFGVFDVPKMALTVGNSPTRLYTDLEVNNNQSGATNSSLIVDFAGTSRVSMRTSGTEVGFLASTNTPELLIGSNSANNVSFVYNGARTLTFRAANATGSSTGTFTTANKPGANAGVIDWLQVSTPAGNGVIPVIGV